MSERHSSTTFHQRRSYLLSPYTPYGLALTRRGRLVSCARTSFRLWACRLGKLVGNGPNLRLNLQRAYDLHQAQQKVGKEIEKIRTLKAVA